MIYKLLSKFRLFGLNLLTAFVLKKQVVVFGFVYNKKKKNIFNLYFLSIEMLIFV